jgi:hypothetical protein
LLDFCRLAVKSKGAEKPFVLGSGGKAGKDPVNGSKGKAPKTIMDIMEEMQRGSKGKNPTVGDFLEEIRRQPALIPTCPRCLNALTSYSGEMRCDDFFLFRGFIYFRLDAVCGTQLNLLLTDVQG